MFRKILVANRGEVAVRILRAAREMGIKTVAIYSEADRDSLHVKLADEAVCVGPASSQQSYLNISGIISACEIANADALHPGYGFLAEDYRFAEACEESGIVFIGPTSRAIRRMGDKTAARAAMKLAGLTVTPGSDGVVSSVGEALELGGAIGYPLLLKAKQGGGGKGMRLVWGPDEVETAFRIAGAEANAAFGCGDLYLEKFITRPRHIEVQLAGDTTGRVVHFFERDCSVQRRHQKLVEESPSPALDEATRRKLGAQAVRGAAHVGYSSLGTMEFLLDEDGSFYFMEMNTRLQVEHPVTEEVTGWDLVKLQIELAAGEPLPMRQEEIRLNGAALECRINAEDPAKGFRPCPGEITYFYQPGGGGVRMDTHIYPGYRIPPFYDSLLGKLIAHGRSRREVIARMERALDELVLDGVSTTVPFHKRVLKDARFLRGNYNTGFVELLLGEERGQAKPFPSQPIASP
ncbi:MAG: acetyl-CoA carboxylase biotin carboxylase subunit [Candidatus Eisenbacteria sp.]|nr:acetyl-CoA carboxylase biotin carboxylase subunit [Candidatus Eisenbacteria bacterium]